MATEAGAAGAESPPIFPDAFELSLSSAWQLSRDAQLQALGRRLQRAPAGAAGRKERLAISFELNRRRASVASAIGTAIDLAEHSLPSTKLAIGGET